MKSTTGLDALRPCLQATALLAMLMLPVGAWSADRGANVPAGKQASTPMPPPKPGIVPTRSSPFDYEHYYVDYDVHEDGSYTETIDLVVRLAEGGKAPISQPWRLTVLPGLEARERRRDVQVLDAYTRKANGERVEAVQAEPGRTPGLPQEADKYRPARLLTFRNLTADDAMVLSYRVERAYFDLGNNVVIDQSFPKSTVYEDARVTLRAPATLPLRFKVVEMKAAKEEREGKRRKWTWQFVNKTATSFVTDELNNWSTVHITSFPDDATEAHALMAAAAGSQPNVAPSLADSAAHSAAAPGSIAPDVLDRELPEGYARPVSQWETTEKATFMALLGRGNFDALVVPFQVQQAAVDRPTRSLMTAELALALAQASKARVPDPYLTARALGEGRRHLDQSEVMELAEKLGVNRLVWGFVGHDRRGSMRLTLRSQRREPGKSWSASLTESFTFDKTASFTDERPPIEAFEALLPQLLVALGEPAAGSSPVRAESAAEFAEFPFEPLELSKMAGDAARQALCFQLLAYLSPAAVDRARERFAEKSILALRRVSPQDPRYRVLKARAYMLLGMRPAALRALDRPKTPQEKELVALLNGNQPDVDAARAELPPGIEGVLAALDAETIASAYRGASRERAERLARSLALPGEIWPMLVSRAFAGLDDWSQFDNFAWKQLLDRDFRIEGYGLEGQIRGSTALNDNAGLQSLQQVAVLRHVRKLLQSDAGGWCCHLATDRPGSLDYLQLIEAVGEDNVLRQVEILTNRQGLYERALDDIGRMEANFRGHARLALAQAQAQVGRAEAANGVERDNLVRAAHGNFQDAMYWAQGQTAVSAAAFHGIEALLQSGNRGLGVLHNFYASDRPFRAFYPSWEAGGLPAPIEANELAALANATYDVTPLRDLAWLFSIKGMDPGRKWDGIVKSVEKRFAGNPEVYQLRAQYSLRKGDEASAEEQYRAGIEVQPNVWEPYRDLGTLLINRGELKAASALFAQFPPFQHEVDHNPVSLANEAYEAGSKFYRVGEFELATPFFEIASRRSTNAASDIVSGARLAMLRGDWGAASERFLECAQHYNDAECYEYYLDLWFAMGGKSAAWDAFRVLAEQFDDSDLWEAAIVGQRLEGKSEDEVIAWAEGQYAKNAGRRSNRMAIALLRAGVTDRKPSAVLAGALQKLALPVWKNTGANHFVVQPPYGGGIEYIVGPRIKGSDQAPQHPAAGERSPEKLRVQSHLAYLAQAKQAIGASDFAGALRALQEASTLYDLSRKDGGTSYLLPYFAFAAAKAGKVQVVEAYLADFTPEQKAFDYLLARAVVAGMGGDTQQSVQLLHRALYQKPYSSGRGVDPGYEYAEICAWLFVSTVKEPFRQEALDWTRKMQRSEPDQAWTWSLEAMLADESDSRARAIAMASYLDPRSAWLQQVPEEERTRAVSQFSRANPFLKGGDQRFRHGI